MDHFPKPVRPDGHHEEDIREEGIFPALDELHWRV
jgi:hypothetical protein